jgi:hypothetical protein
MDRVMMRLGQGLAIFAALLIALCAFFRWPFYSWLIIMSWTGLAVALLAHFFVRREEKADSTEGKDSAHGLQKGLLYLLVAVVAIVWSAVTAAVV